MLVLALGLFSFKGKEKEKSTTSEKTTSQKSSIPGTAFALVDDGLHEIITTMEEDNVASCRQFEYALCQNPEKVKCWYDKAVSVRKVSNEFYAYVQNFKDEMVEQAEGEAKPNAHVRDLKKQDDTNVPQRYAINEGNAAILKGKINEYREFMIDITGHSPALDEELRQTFTTPGGVNAEGEPISWEDAMFNEMPICASLTVLTKLQNDIRYCEGRAIRYLLTRTDASDLRVNKFAAYVIPSSNYVKKGDDYEAQIVFATVNSELKPQFYVDGELVQNGYYRVKTDKVGKHKLRGKIVCEQQSGETISLPFEREYTVVE
jgi:gliding motility-associated protein GldM